MNREELAQLKKGEETKCKTYEALCIKLSHAEDDELTASVRLPYCPDPCSVQTNETSVYRPQANGETAIRVTERDIANINSYSNSDSERVLLSQRTPIRVLHRRPLLTRTRRIHDLTAYPVPGTHRHPSNLAP